jgi:uracil-DNA glycosylase
MTWQYFLTVENKKPYFQMLKHTLAQRYKVTTIYPPKDQVMNAMRLTPFDKVKVVIIGQDPYHGAGQAHGLSFSVQDGVQPPPSLINIFQEVEKSMGYKPNESGNLERWAKQGVLLLNSTLTVEQGRPNSHADIGWQMFTDNAIKKLNEEREGIVFLLWGSFARRKAELIDGDKHLILKATHPSPLSAYNGFFGCDHFRICNTYLDLAQDGGIDWR